MTLQALVLAGALGCGLAAALVGGGEGVLSAMGAGPETGRVHELAAEFLTIRWGGWHVVLLSVYEMRVLTHT